MKNKALTLFLLTTMVAISAYRPLAAAEDSLKRSVVKIFTVVKPADYYQPWQMGYQQQATGSGFIIAGNRLLTNAHVVSNQVHIQLLKAGDTKKYTARVQHVAHDSEIAILQVEDPDFFEGTKAVEFGDLPFQRDKVAAYGFPVGGNELSITEGVVSRIEVQTYTHSQNSLLTIQTDAAINPGNSGGPVFKDGKLIGISFQSYSGSSVENTGYIIPVSIINRFLKDVEDGEYDGVPSMGFYWQKMENESLRSYHGLTKDQSGVRITRVIYGSPAFEKIEEGDVLTHLDGVNLADNGTVAFRNDERISFSNLLSKYQMGDNVTLSLIRDGKAITKNLTFKNFAPLVQPPAYDERASYFIFAGFVFTPLSYNYMKVWRWNDVLSRFKDAFERGMPDKNRDEIVFAIQVLPHDINLGYHKLAQVVVEKVNGTPVHNMKDLVKAFSKPMGKYHVIEVDHHAGDSDNSATKIVLDATRTKKATEEILESFGIPSDRSDDLKEK